VDNAEVVSLHPCVISIIADEIQIKFGVEGLSQKLPGEFTFGSYWSNML